MGNISRGTYYISTESNTSQIARIAVTSFKLHESRSNVLLCIYNQYMQSYNSLLYTLHPLLTCATSRLFRPVSQSARFACAKGQATFSNKSFEILLNDNNKLKNDTVLFFREKYNRVNSCCQSALKIILNDSPFNFGRYTSL